MNYTKAFILITLTIQSNIGLSLAGNNPCKNELVSYESVTEVSITWHDTTTKTTYFTNGLLDSVIGGDYKIRYNIKNDTVINTFQRKDESPVTFKCYWESKKRTTYETSKNGNRSERFGFKKYDKNMNLIQALESFDGTESTYKYENGKLIYSEDRGEDGASFRTYKYEIDSVNGIARKIEFVKYSSVFQIDKHFKMSWVSEENIGSVLRWRRIYQGTDTTLFENEYDNDLLVKKVRIENSKRKDSVIYHYK